MIRYILFVGGQLGVGGFRGVPPTTNLALSPVVCGVMPFPVPLESLFKREGALGPLDVLFRAFD
jgi:hypothetical protein